MKTLVFSLLVYASLCCAQPWQWEQYQGTFWHQAPNEIPWAEADEYEFGSSVVGDFNGNGRDEVLFRAEQGFLYGEVNSSGNILDWGYNYVPVSPNPDVVVHFSQALNLDDDSNDELIIYSQLLVEPFTSFVQAYNSDSPHAPNFVERPDLIESLAFPGFPSSSMFGNFDRDSLLDGFVLTSTGLQYYERENASWILRETLSAQPYSDAPFYLAADVNSDGDMEVGFYEPGIDCNCMWGWLFDSRNDSIFLFDYDFDVLLYPGDYDGDGNTEAFLESFELSLPSRLVRLGAGDPFTTTELANQWEANSPVVYSGNTDGEIRVYSFYNGERFQWGSWTMVPAGYSLQWSESGWERVSDGSWFGNVYDGNTADLDGDGGNEYIFRMLATDWFGPDRIVWSMGIGNLERFFDNADTVFTNPRIGDVEGDGAGELVTRVASGAPAGLYFYELERDGNQVIAHHKPYLSEGLPTNMTEFTLADIDNDGHAELFINTGYWRTFFFRNGHWDEYTGILPTGIGLNLYFADFEGDGDLDVFSQNGVWISLSPSAADDELILYPSSLILSVYPNPFNAQTTLQFDLPNAGNVTLKIFDLLGRAVETILDQNMTAGAHVIRYDAAHLSSGVYFARLTAGELTTAHKLLLLK